MSMIAPIALLLGAVQNGGGVAATPSSTCNPPFRNGQLFDTSFPVIPNSPEFHIENATSENAVVRLQSISSLQSATVYVARGSTASIQSIPPGHYEVRVAYSGVMASDCVTLAAASSIQRMDELQSFEVIETETEVEEGILVEKQWTVGTLKLYEKQVRRGSAEPDPGSEKMSLIEFNAQ